MKLFRHQIIAADRASAAKRYGLFFDPGAGKTIASLEVVRRDPIKTLVVCPKSIMESAWCRDAATMGIPCTVLWGTAAKRKRLVESAWNLGVCTFEGFKAHAKEWKALGVQRLIIDESSKIKAHDSQVSRAAHWVADGMAEVFLLSGTPAPNSPAEYWSQLRCLGVKFSGSSYWSFESKYTVPIKREIFAGGRMREVTVGHRQTEEQRAALIALLDTCSWTLRKQDCIDLPEQTDHVVIFDLADDERKVYDAAAEALPFALDASADEMVQFRADAALIKCRQITGGFVNVESHARMVGASKREALIEQLDSLGSRPCIIWAEFTAEIDCIAEVCRARGETFAIIDGRTSHEAGSIAARFQRGEITRLVCHPQAAGHGITLTAASYAIYYSLGFSAENHKQSRDRIHRIGQVNRCTYIYLIARDTVDIAALKVVQKKQKQSDEIKDALAARGAVGAGNIRDEKGPTCQPLCETTSPPTPSPSSRQAILSRSDAFGAGVTLFRITAKPTS